MREMQLREAKATFSAVVEAAENGEPVMITKNGRPSAVVLSHAEWKRLNTAIPTLADLLLAMPMMDEDSIPKRKPARATRESPPE